MLFEPTFVNIDSLRCGKSVFRARPLSERPNAALDERAIISYMKAGAYQIFSFGFDV